MQHWLDFLSQQGAPWPARTLEHPDGHLIPMTEFKLITVTGPDAASFLQGQCTCDMRRLEQQEVLLGAHCNPKGRMLSSFAVARTAPDSITLRVRADLADACLAYFKKYLVFAKASIAFDTRVALALLRKEALPGSNTETLDELPPPGRFSTLTQWEATVLHHNDGLVELWLAPEHAQALWPQLVPSYSPSSIETLELHWVRQGLAHVQAATQEAFIPQMFNYQVLGGISFKKGCYTGQEIVARMQYRGQLKKHAYRAVAQVPAKIPVGAALASEQTPDKTAATVVASASTPEGCEVLVVAAEDLLEQGHLLLKQGETQINLAWAPLPYAIP